jgi:hypothetical protein
MKQNTAALKFAKSILERRGSVGQRSRRIIMKGLLQEKNSERALQWLYDSVKQKDIELVHLLIEHYITNKSFDQAQNLISFAKNSGFPLTEKTYGLIVAGMIKEGQLKDSVSMLKKVKVSGSVVGDQVYVVFLEDYIKNADWNQVETLWTELIKKPLRDPVVVCFIRYLALTNQISRIDDLKQLLDAEKHPQSFQTLVLVYLRTHAIDKATMCLKEMQSLGATSDHAYAYNHFISYFARYFRIT